MPRRRGSYRHRQRRTCCSNTRHQKRRRLVTLVEIGRDILKERNCSKNGDGGNSREDKDYCQNNPQHLLRAGLLFGRLRHCRSAGTRPLILVVKSRRSLVVRWLALLWVLAKSMGRLLRITERVRHVDQPNREPRHNIVKNTGCEAHSPSELFSLAAPRIRLPSDEYFRRSRPPTRCCPRSR